MVSVFATKYTASTRNEGQFIQPTRDAQLPLSSIPRHYKRINRARREILES